MYQFSESDSDEDNNDFVDGFYFGSNLPIKETNHQVSINTNDTSYIAEHISKSITQIKTKTNDFETLEFENDYKINKTWLIHLIKELEFIHSQTKKKTIKSTLDQALNAPPNVCESMAKLSIQKPESSIDAKSLQKIKQIEEEMMKKFESKLCQEFTASKHPFWFCLILIENCPDYSVNKYNSLACNIVRFFDKWTNEQHLDSFNLTNEIMLSAFILSCKYHMLLVELLAKIYKFHQVNDLILPYLKYRISSECHLRWKLDFKDKALLISACMLHEHFNFEEILMPLLLQDKLSVLEKYLAKNSTQQKEFVQFLDKIFANHSNLSTYFYRYSQIKNVQSDKLTNKYLGKLLTRLIKTYQIDASLCPNINNQRFFKNLKYLIYRRYVEQSINYEPWFDLISECLTQAEYLNEHFIEMLADHNDYKEIHKWIKLLNINNENLSSYTLKRLKETENLIDNEIKTTIDNRYYQLRLDSIKFIDKCDMIIECVNEIVNCRHKTKSGHIFVGIDAEWKPSMVSGVNDELSKRASLIQISTHDHVYLIDMCTLYSLLDQTSMDYFTQNFIYNKNIIKVGYGFTEDIKKISHSFNAPDHDQFRQSVLDLEYLVGQINSIDKTFFNYEKSESQEEEIDAKERGLSELVRLCFGKPLNKSEQISNWDKRPLRQNQITYAALDAYVLLEVYEYIKERLIQQKINLDIHRCIGKRYKLPSNGQNKVKEKKIAQQLEEQQLNEIKKFEDENFKLNEQPISVTDLRVVCDNMLGGLGKELRRCGVDTLILENDRKHTDVARIARNENRYALSSGLPYFMIKSQLPEGRCIYVKTETAKVQCAQVLKTLNVEVKVADLFSRCRACNCGSYTIINKSQCKALWYKCKCDFPELFVGYEKSKAKFQSKLSSTSLDTIDYDFKSDRDLLDKVDICTFHLASSPNVRVQFESIFDTTLEVVSLYYICDGCGHIYWEGPHWHNLTGRFSHVLTEKEIESHTKTDKS